MPVLDSKIIWDDNPRNPKGLTALGYYDDSEEFLQDAVKFAKWASRKLGYPIMEVELTDENFYNAFEEAVIEYSSHVLRFELRENLQNLKGTSFNNDYTGTDLSQAYRRGIIENAKPYANEIEGVTGEGPYDDWKKTYFETEPGVQEYDLNKIIREKENIPEDLDIEIKKVYHYEFPTFKKSMIFASSYINADFGNQLLGTSFNNSYTYLLFPINETLWRAHALRTVDKVYKSHFSFEIKHNRIRLFPIPKTKFRVYLDYIVCVDEPVSNTKVSSYADATFKTYYKYERINAPGRAWIRQYALACCKEMLGLIRAKYATIPAPGESIMMNGQDLIVQAQTEKQTLVENLKMELEMSGQSKFLEDQLNRSSLLRSNLVYFPLNKIYIG